jgi:hypothetical protein
MREESRRLSIAEIQIVELKRRLADAEARIARLELMLNQMTGGGGGGGGTLGSFWCRSPGFAAATGTWPTITPASNASVTIYQSVGGALVSYASSQTVYWYYKDASTVNKLMAVSQNTDGTWDALLDSCTAV